MNQTPDNSIDATERNRSKLKPIFLGLVCLLVIGLIIVVGFKLFVIETSLTIINGSSQEMQHCVLLDQAGQELFRTESMFPDQRQSSSLYNFKPSGEITFQTTLADGTTREGVFTFDRTRASKFDIKLLSFEITDQNLINKTEVSPRIPIKERIRSLVFW